jgi:hypothetical protein
MKSPDWQLSALGIPLTKLGYNSLKAPDIVGLTIPAACWFTSSTSFANPGRDRGAFAFGCIRRHRAPRVAALIAAKLVGMLAAAVILGRWLWRV